MATHTIYYDFSSIVCQISGGSNKLIENVEAYIMSLDPDSIHQVNKSHLAFEWSCSCHTMTLNLLEKQNDNGGYSERNNV